MGTPDNIIGHEEEIMKKVPEDILKMFTDAVEKLPSQSGRLSEMVAALWNAHECGESAFEAQIIVFKRDLEELSRQSMSSAAARLRAMIARSRESIGQSGDSQSDQ